MSSDASASASDPSSAGAGITGGYEGDSLALKVCIAFFLGLAIYNVLELLVLIFGTFQKYVTFAAKEHNAKDSQISRSVLLVSGRIRHWDNSVCHWLLNKVLQYLYGKETMGFRRPSIHRLV